MFDKENVIADQQTANYTCGTHSFNIRTLCRRVRALARAIASFSCWKIGFLQYLCVWWQRAGNLTWMWRDYELDETDCHFTKIHHLYLISINLCFTMSHDTMNYSKRFVACIKCLIYRKVWAVSRFILYYCSINMRILVSQKTFQITCESSFVPDYRDI